MGPREITHRVIEKAKKRTWRHNLRGWDNFSSICDGSLRDLSAIRQCLSRAPAALGEDALKTLIQRTRDGNLEFLGCRWTNEESSWRNGAPPPKFWLQSPAKGRVWAGADSYCFDVRYRHGSAHLGDVKYVWELNRLQFLHPIAAGIAATARADLARWAFRIVASWMAANPPYRGINWVSGIELSLRLVSFALLIAAVGPSAMEPGERTMMRQLIAAHGYWLHRYPSLYSSANNHLIAEGLGLFIAGVLAPDISDAEEWWQSGRHILEMECNKQILEDGVGVEQSPTYQAFTMEMIALAAILADSIDEPLSGQTLNRLALGAEHLDWILDSAGHAPAIGDNDEGRAIGQPPDREPRYVASVVAAIAGLTKLAVSPPHDPHIRDVIFSTPVEQRAAREGMRIFPAGGYSVVHDRINDHAVDLVFDHGPLGYLSLAAHGHADALAVWLTIDGVSVFVDAGTYLYHSGGAMRDRLRETMAHNSLVLHGQSQSRITGPFMWGAKAVTRITTSHAWPDWSISGEHDGYAKRFGVTHARCVEKQKREIAIVDRLIGADRWISASIQFLCHPDLTVTSQADGVLVSRNTTPILAIVAPANFQTRIIIGECSTGRGWYSPRFGDLLAAPLITFTGGLAEQEVTTRLKIL